jgi:glucosamine 6-phosphate synthetase-like amidotransferase/phosphosugar isomerase protein
MEETNESKVYRLTQELEQTRKEKKAHMKAYNEEIKRISEEIKELLPEG